MASNLRVFRPDGALMVFPCMGSLTQVTMHPAFRTARTKAGNFSRSFSAPMRTITVSLPGLFSGFNISQSFTRSAGGILSLTCKEGFIKKCGHIKTWLHQSSSTCLNYEVFSREGKLRPWIHNGATLMGEHLLNSIKQCSIERCKIMLRKTSQTLTPNGLETPRRNSMCAPSSWRVRSPIHSMWAEQS